MRKISSDEHLAKLSLVRERIGVDVWASMTNDERERALEKIKPKEKK